MRHWKTHANGLVNMPIVPDSFQHPQISFSDLTQLHYTNCKKKLRRTLIVKRSFDAISALVALIVFSPVLLAAAIAVKLTSVGPILYRQKRVGRYGKVFTIYKFRSMRVDAEKDGPVWAQEKNDSRLTSIGAFLRRSHIDELPQLVNILNGSMSLVGPRPERPHFVSKLQHALPRYALRHTVRPGLTGFAQMNYQYDQSIKHVRQKLRYDLLYIESLSIWLDIRIVFGTVKTIIANLSKLMRH